MFNLIFNWEIYAILMTFGNSVIEEGEESLPDDNGP